MSGPASSGSPYPGYPEALHAEADGLRVEGDELLEAASELSVEEFDSRLEHLVARAEALWGQAGWTESEQQISALGMRMSLRLLARTLRDEQ